MLVLGKRLQRFILLITVGGMLGGVWSVAVVKFRRVSSQEEIR